MLYRRTALRAKLEPLICISVRLTSSGRRIWDNRRHGRGTAVFNQIIHLFNDLRNTIRAGGTFHPLLTHSGRTADALEPVSYTHLARRLSENAALRCERCQNERPCYHLGACGNRFPEEPQRSFGSPLSKTASWQGFLQVGWNRGAICASSQWFWDEACFLSAVPRGICAVGPILSPSTHLSRRIPQRALPNRKDCENV